MNKIIVSQEKKLELKDIETEIVYAATRLDLYIFGTVVLNEIICETEKLELNIKIAEGSSLKYNKLGIIHNHTLNINIDQSQNSSFDFNYSFITTGETNIKINSSISENNNKNIMNIRAIAEENGSINIVVNGNIVEKTVENELVENIKCLTINDNKCTIIPNMLINTDEVSAAHNVSIGNIDEISLFYLNSKGISKNAAEKLIKDGFIINNLELKSEDFIRIKEILNGR